MLTSFVPEEFTETLSVEDLFTIDKSFISEEFINRESDIIYRVKRGEKEVYIYILMEFQSTPDKTIAARVLSYIMRLYESFLQTSQAGKLPAVFPIVLYNGTEEWLVPENIADLIEHTIRDDYIPHFRYFKIIERDIPDEVLFQLNNLVAAVIYLEKQRNAAQLEEAITKIIDMLKHEELIDVKQFSFWVKRMLTFPEKDTLVDEIKDITEVKPMLTKIAEQLRAEGEARGKAETLRETAKKMRVKGISIEQIQEITGLTREEIERL